MTFVSTSDSKSLGLPMLLAFILTSFLLIGHVTSFVDYDYEHTYAPAPAPTTTTPAPTTTAVAYANKKYNFHDLESYVDKISKHLVHVLHNIKGFLKSHKKWVRQTRSVDRILSNTYYYPLDVVMIFDSSEAMGLDKFQCAKYFAKFIASNLNLVNGVDVAGTNIGILSYSKSAKVELDVEHGISLEQLNQKIDNIKFWGGRKSNTEKALSSALRMLSKSVRPNAIKIVISFTPRDEGKKIRGNQNLSYLQTLYKEKGIKLFGVVLGGDKGDVGNIIENVNEEPFYSYITVPPVCQSI